MKKPSQIVFVKLEFRYNPKALRMSDDLSKGISAKDDDDIGVIGQVASHFKRLYKVNPGLASEDLGADGLIKIDAEMKINNAVPLTLL